MGVLSLYERVAGLFSTLATSSPWVNASIEGLCLETRAQGGVLWVVEDLNDSTHSGSSERRAASFASTQEPEVFDAVRSSARTSSPFTTRVARSFCRGRSHGASCGRLRIGAATRDRHSTFRCRTPVGNLVGIARLSGQARQARTFDGSRSRGRCRQVRRTSAPPRWSNALRFRALERRSFRDPTTKAYTLALLEGRGTQRDPEVRPLRAPLLDRAGRCRMEIDGLLPLRRSRFGDASSCSWLELPGPTSSAEPCVTTDLLATESESSVPPCCCPRPMPSAPPSSSPAHPRGRWRRGRLHLGSGIDRVERGRIVALCLGHLSDATPPSWTRLQARCWSGRLLEDNRVSPLAAHVAPGPSIPSRSAIDDTAPSSAEPQSPRRCPCRSHASCSMDDLARRPRDRGLLVRLAGAGA